MNKKEPCVKFDFTQGIREFYAVFLLHRIILCKRVCVKFHLPLINQSECDIYDDTSLRILKKSLWLLLSTKTSLSHFKVFDLILFKDRTTHLPDMIKPCKKDDRESVALKGVVFSFWFNRS